MASHAQAGITTLVGEVRAGDREARSRLLDKVYDDLRGIAGRFLRGKSSDFTLQASDVVDEAFLRLFGKDFRPENRNHFFGAAAKAMREVVAEHARKRHAQKRGAGYRRVALDDVVDYFERRDLPVEAVREALDRLAEIRPRQSQVVTLRHFFRYTAEETAALLEISGRTVRNDERFARAWLRGELAEAAP
jgi:RNA polymerase sigma factor (TIGR02999 family)